MTYTLDWRENALNSLAGYLDDDRAGVRELFTVLDELTANPYPPTPPRSDPRSASGSAATASSTKSKTTPSPCS
ncbi:hypothetical protein GCM10009872_54310 [Actinopolymorpha rutila]